MTLPGNAHQLLKLHRESTLIVVMDVQERIVRVMPDECCGLAIDNVIRLIQGARVLRLPVVVTEQYSQGLGRTIEPVSQALEELDPSPLPIDKLQFDGCEDPQFTAEIERSLPPPANDPATEVANRGTVVLCGMETHVCIYQTARSLVEQGYGVHVPLDATCSRRPDHRKIAHGLLDRLGAVVTCTETLLFDLLRRADNDEFRAIVKLVR